MLRQHSPASSLRLASPASSMHVSLEIPEEDESYEEPQSTASSISLASFRKHLTDARNALKLQMPADKKLEASLIAAGGGGGAGAHAVSALDMLASCGQRFTCTQDKLWRESQSGKVDLFGASDHIVTAVKPIPATTIPLWERCFTQSSVDLTPPQYVDLLLLVDYCECEPLLRTLVQQPIVTTDNVLVLLAANTALDLKRFPESQIAARCREEFRSAVWRGRINEAEIVAVLFKQPAILADIDASFANIRIKRVADVRTQLLTALLRSHAAGGAKCSSCSECQDTLRSLPDRFYRCCNVAALCASMAHASGVCEACAALLQQRVKQLHAGAFEEAVEGELRMLSTLCEAIETQLTPNSNPMAPQKAKASFLIWARLKSRSQQSSYPATLKQAAKSCAAHVRGLPIAMMPCTCFDAATWQSTIHDMTLCCLDAMEPQFYDDVHLQSNAVPWTAAAAVAAKCPSGRLVVRSGQRVLLTGDDTRTTRVVVEDGGHAVLLGMNRLQRVEVSGQSATLLMIGCRVVHDATDPLVCATDAATAVVVGCSLDHENTFFDTVRVDSGSNVLFFECDINGACRCCAVSGGARLLLVCSRLYGAWQAGLDIGDGSHVTGIGSQVQGIKGHTAAAGVRVRQHLIADMQSIAQHSNRVMARFYRCKLLSNRVGLQHDGSGRVSCHSCTFANAKVNVDGHATCIDCTPRQ